MKRWAWTAFVGLACCGGIAVIDEPGGGYVGGGGGTGGNSGGNSAGPGSSSGGAGLDGGVGDGAADAGPPICCNVLDGPLPAEQCHGGGDDALCDPGEVCTLIQGDGEWYCLPPGV
jgi:hypothetical protein